MWMDAQFSSALSVPNGITVTCWEVANSPCMGPETIRIWEREMAFFSILLYPFDPCTHTGPCHIGILPWPSGQLIHRSPSGHTLFSRCHFTNSLDPARSFIVMSDTCTNPPLSYPTFFKYYPFNVVSHVAIHSNSEYVVGTHAFK